MNIKIEPMHYEDLPEVMALEHASFTSPWSEQFFMDELERDFSYIFTARLEDGSLAGFICFWVLFEDMHILNLAVAGKHRRKGIGRALVKKALKFALKLGAVSATLEVRQKNEPATGFYNRLGFEKAGVRKNYYESPPDNAVIMWLYDIAAALEKMP
jgi:ribosomal-protein-alanine N-acetyltransferase